MLTVKLWKTFFQKIYVIGYIFQKLSDISSAINSYISIFPEMKVNDCFCQPDAYTESIIRQLNAAIGRSKTGNNSLHFIECLPLPYYLLTASYLSGTERAAPD